MKIEFDFYPRQDDIEKVAKELGINVRIAGRKAKLLFRDKAKEMLYWYTVVEQDGEMKLIHTDDIKEKPNDAR